MNFDRIKALLNLAKDNTNDNEAAAAFAKAAALASKMGVEIAVVEAQLGQTQQREEFVDTEVGMGQRFPVAFKFVGLLMKDAFNVNIVYSGGRSSGRRVTFLGRKSDVEMAVYASEFLLAEFERRWKYYKASHGLDNRAKNAYLYGMYEGFRDKAKQEKETQKAAAVEGQTPEVREKFGLVLVSEESQRQQFVGQKFPNLRKGKTVRLDLNRKDVISDGRAAGATISVNRPLTNR